VLSCPPGPRKEVIMKCEHCGKEYDDYDPSGTYCPHCGEYSQG